jgi:16S rRNA (guanine527-N7)-methyltransferase
MVARETSIARFLSATNIPAGPEEISRLARYAEILATRALAAGFLGPNEGPRILERHLFESLALWPIVGSRGGRWVDVGSGAGLPGVPLACLGLTMTLVESQARRARFLRDVSAELGLSTETLEVRAEDLGRSSLRESFDGVTSRALATLPVALELCLPLVGVGGLLVFAATPGDDAEAAGALAAPTRSDAGTRPPSESAGEEAASGTSGRHLPRSQVAGPSRSTDLAPSDTRAAAPVAGQAPALAQTRHPGSPPTDPRRAGSPVRGGASVPDVASQLGGGMTRWQELTVPGGNGLRWVIIVEKVQPTPDRFPRRAGVPKRRPLG